jgi:hypothetical protein
MGYLIYGGAAALGGALAGATVWVVDNAGLVWAVLVS